MFTGLIEETGTVSAIQVAPEGAQLRITASHVVTGARLGDSVAVNGCCLTISSRTENELTFDLLRETLDRTNLKALEPGTQVNLERALAAGATLGGHFVQGHIDCAVPVMAAEEQLGPDLRLEVQLPGGFAQYVVPKGSIAVNGVSLTVAEVAEKSFAVWVIPHTRANTNLGKSREGDWVNLEFDLLAKYVERMLAHRVVRPR
jgi:riboflavin synthase